MKQVTVSLTEAQEKFLKEFAEKQYDGAKENVATVSPIHVVENKRFSYIPYSSEIKDHFDELPLTFTSDEDYECWHDDEIELIKDWYENREEECPIEIKPFSEVYRKGITGIDGEEEVICDYHEYFEVYGVKVHAIAWKKEEWEPTAFFFIRDEAKRYIKYQAHNLKQPRIYTYAPGYANYGDFVPFRDLLLSLGKQLTEKEEVEK